ncbi:MAG TPA: AgmX/PglI C-terminal domain-containing protein [Kofleriaceae bacterium]|jgi:hypothetical protein
MSNSIKLALVALLFASACKSGPDPQIHTMIGAKLASAQPTIQDCFQSSLTTNRKLRGMMVLQMAVNEKGEFVDISTRRDEPNDPVLRFCVTKAFAALKLDKAPGARVQLDSVPVKFEWTKP